MDVGCWLLDTIHKSCNKLELRFLRLFRFCSVLFFRFTNSLSLPQKLHVADDGDDYMNSEWANPNTLKNQFQGIGNVKWGAK